MTGKATSGPRAPLRGRCTGECSDRFGGGEVEPCGSWRIVLPPHGRWAAQRSGGAGRGNSWVKGILGGVGYFFSKAGRAGNASVVAGLVLAVLLGAASYLGSRRLGAHLYVKEGRNVWFQSDGDRVLASETDRNGVQERSEVHPLYALVTYPPVFVLRHVAGLGGLEASRVLHAGVAAVWMGLLFGLLRRIGLSLGDAILLALVGGSSAASFFWFIQIDTFPLGSATLLLALLAAAAPRGPGFVHSVLVGAATLGITVTNWMCALLVARVRDRRRFVRIAVATVLVVAALALLQKALFPHSNLFFLGSKKEVAFMLRGEAGGPRSILRALAFHTMVMPRLRLIYNPFKPERLPWLSVQFSGLAVADGWGVTAVGAWAVLLALGLRALFRMETHKPLRTVLRMTLLGQVLLHLIYGEETFLYASHFLALLVATAALPVLGRGRNLTRLAAVVFVVAAAVNNLQRLGEALELVEDPQRWRQAGLAQMHPPPPPRLWIPPADR